MTTATRTAAASRALRGRHVDQAPAPHNITHGAISTVPLRLRTPRHPDHAVVGPGSEPAERERGGAAGGADRRAREGDHRREAKGVLRILERTAAAGKAIDEIGREQTFGRVAAGDRERGGNECSTVR